MHKSLIHLIFNIMRKRLHSLFLLTLLSFLCTLSVVAQVTTASMSGEVSSNNEPVIGATIVALHEPSGTTYGTVTNLDGRFDLQGMRTGGPYKVTVSYIGYQTAIYKDVVLQLGEIYNLKVALKESSEQLEEVVVTASKSKFITEKTGASLIFLMRRWQISRLLTVAYRISLVCLLMLQV